MALDTRTFYGLCDTVIFFNKWILHSLPKYKLSEKTLLENLFYSQIFENLSYFFLCNINQCSFKLYISLFLGRQRLEFKQNICCPNPFSELSTPHRSIPDQPFFVDHSFGIRILHSLSSCFFLYGKNKICDSIDFRIHNKCLCGIFIKRRNALAHFYGSFFLAILVIGCMGCTT